MNNKITKTGYGALLPAVATTAFVLYTVALSQSVLPLYQWIIAFALLFIAVACHSFLKSDSSAKVPDAVLLLSIFIIYLIASFAIFHPTLTNLFRSDYWIIMNLFGEFGDLSTQTLLRISLFEIFGDPRFQPLAHLSMYFRHLLFGNSVTLYHISNIALHAGVAFIVYLLSARISKRKPLAFILGFLFITLQSQFDTVAWTYHIYIILGTALLLAAFYLQDIFHERGSRGLFIAALFCSLLSLLLYEPALLGPAALFTLALVPILQAKGPLNRRRLFFIISILFIAYLAWFAITYYGYSITKSGHKMDAGDLLSWSNITKSIQGALTQILHNNFLKNIGIAAKVTVTDIVYLYLPDDLFSFKNIIKIAMALVVLFSFRLKKEKALTVALLLLLAISYILIISIGRVHSNTIAYLTSQPRYQYLPNALFLVAASVLLARHYSRGATGLLRRLITPFLFAMLFWNIQNVSYGNNRVDEEMDFIDSHYYALKGFTEENPDAKIYMTFTPSSGFTFTLGADIALDLLLEGRLTNFPERATHIYREDKSFGKNPYKRIRAAADSNAVLGDFYISWLYYRFKEEPPYKEVVIVGSDDELPKISIHADGLLRVKLKELSTGRVQELELRHPYIITDEGVYLYKENKSFATIELAKQGDTLCLYFNNILSDKINLNGRRYENWRKDGRALLGSHYIGEGGASYSLQLFKQMSLSDFDCTVGK